MTRAQRGLAVLTALVGLAVAACSGDDSPSNDRASDERPTEEAATSSTESETTTTTQDEPSGDAVGSSELTPPGTELAMGEAANLPVDYAGVQGVVGVTVDSLARGTPADLALLALEGGETGDLYYVTMTIQNTGSPGDLGSYVPNTIYLFPLQEDGRPANPVAKFTAFPPCENEDPSDLAPGASFTTCEIYLAQSGAAVSSVVFTDFDAEPIVWRQ